MTSHALPARREAVLVLLLTLLGAILRFWSPGRLGLVHFDEGIYALAGLWFASPKGLAGIDPSLIPFAPPGYPTLVGVFYMLLGVGDIPPILVSQLAGVATIPVVGWIGRRAFGRGAGASSSALAALAGAHVAFSRMALTDSVFLFVWLLALGFGGRFLDRPTLLRALPLGLAVGLAQNVKYNGALSGVCVALSALIVLASTSEKRLGRIVRTLGFGTIAAALAALIYFPWYQFVERHGGYAALLEHHRSYLGGIDDWTRHWRTQMAEQAALSGRLKSSVNWGLIAGLLGGLGGAVASNGPRLVRGPSKREGLRFGAGLLGGSIVLGLTSSAAWWASLSRLPKVLGRGTPTARVVAVAWLVFALLTPFYHPYARLWLPLHALSWLIVGGLIAEFVAASNPSSTVASVAKPELTTHGRRLARGPILLVACLLAAFVIERGGSTPWAPLSGLLDPSDSLRVACAEVAADLARTDSSNPVSRLRVLGRPPAVFYLSMSSPVPVHRVDGPEGLFQPGDPGAAALDDTGLEPRPVVSDLANDWRVSRWVLSRRVENQLNLPTLLDHYPEAAFGRSGGPAGPPSRVSELRLYRPRP